MKFDLIISNPPYNNGLNVKLLGYVWELGDKIAFLHPLAFLLQKKPNNYRSKTFVEIINKVKDYIEVCDYKDDLRKQFGIYCIQNFIGFNLFNKNTKQPIHIDDINIHGTSPIYKSLKKKILFYCKSNNLEKRKLKSHSKNWEVGMATIRGGGISDFHTFIQLTDESVHIGNKTKYPIKYSFDSESEAINFKNYLKTKIARFCLSIYKINQNLCNGELASVPYMPTYERSWTDEDVAKELGLTEEELIWTINWIPDYYPEDPEIYAKYEI